MDVVVVAEERPAGKLNGMKQQPHQNYDQIPLAAEFRPSEEEFREPLDYINKIRPVAEAYGICKIVPPANWRPKFSLDINQFKFRPRVQRLNELEANNRIKLQFLDKLAQFWELQGKRFRNPVLEGRPVDLYKLLKIVSEQGGMDAVTNNKRWSQLARQLDYKEAQSARILRGHYENLLHPYELFEAGSTLPPQQPVKIPSVICLSDEDPCHQGGRCGGGKKRSMHSISPNKRQAVDSRRSSSNNSDNQICLVCKRGDDEAFMLLCDECDDSYHTFCLVPPLKEVPKGDWRCPVCLAALCKEPGESYGFEQSKHSYTLAEFNQMADKFKKDYFNGKKSVSLQECEREFWRILSSPDEDVVVEYGADLHTIDTGSGFPTRSDRGKLKHNTDPYVDSPWNLNNLSMLEKSVLSQMNVPISGMKIPWAYVGMCFSCFCWHVEDHWSYSINYLHLGEAKTWYGVSGADAERFEAVMKESAKELFDKSPDLLHHLVTIMDPTFLRSKGVPIYKIYQQEGEFVITFPRAYHAGFNQGFNFAEAVNFCPPDWIPIGREAIESYKKEKRHTVFSHDELVCRVADQVDRLDIETALALEQEFKTMVTFEKAFRRSLMERGIKKGSKLAFELLNDDERTCDYCKTTCYLSAVRCYTCGPQKMVCLNHFDHACDGAEPPATGHVKSKVHHDLRVLYKFDLHELVKFQTNLSKKTEEYMNWCQKVRRALSHDDYDIEIIDELEPNRPLHLNELQKLLDQARLKRYPRYDVEIGSDGRINYSTSSNEHSLYSRLDRECQIGSQCTKMCQKFIEYYKSPTSESALSMSNLFEDNCNDLDTKSFTLKRSLSTKCILPRGVTHHKPNFVQLRQLYQDVKGLLCHIDEKELFMSLMTEAIDFETRIRKLIETTDLEIVTDQLVQQLETATSYLKRVDIEFPSDLVEQLHLLSNRVNWLIKSRELVTGRCTVKTVQDLVDQFVEQNLIVKTHGRGRPSNMTKKNDEIMHGILVHVQELLSLGQTWDNKALAQIQTPNVRIEELEKTLADAKNIPMLLENVDKLERFLKEANKSIVQADALLSDPNYPYLSDLRDAGRQIKSGTSSVRTSSYEGIHIRIERTKDWITTLSKACLKPESWHHHNHHHHQNSSSTDALMNISLLEVLTPRMDMKSAVNKLQLVLDSISDVKKEHSENLNTIEQPATTTTPPSTATGKRQHRTKSVHISQQLMLMGNQQQQQHPGTSSLDMLLNHIDNACDLYKDRNLLTLSEKYKLLQARELEYIKIVRRLNVDKLSMIKTHIIDELKPYVETEDSEADESTPVVDWSKQSLVNIKCCSCAKSILPAVYARSVQQCKLCLGLFHNNCKNASANKYDLHHHVYGRHLAKHTSLVDRDRWDLCHGCERSKRPKLDILASMLVHFENLQTRCYEANALQMFIDRILKWQERYKATVANSEVARLLELMSRCQSRYGTGRGVDELNEIINEMRALSESINVVKRTELAELQLEGMLMESELDECVKLSDLFYLLNQNKTSDLEQMMQALSSEDPRAIQYLDERLKTLNKLNEELKKEKKANQKSQKTANKNSTDGKDTKKENKSGHGNKQPKGSATLTGKKNKISEKNGKADTSQFRKKNQKENATRTKKRDHSEVDEISDELCAAPKCTQPTGDNIKWVQCDGDCNRWFHMICMGISKIRKREQYICEACTTVKREDEVDGIDEMSVSVNNTSATSARSSSDSVNVTVDFNLVELKTESDELKSHLAS